MDTFVVALGLTTFACLLTIGGQFLHIRSLVRQKNELQSKHNSLCLSYESQALETERYKTKFHTTNEQLGRVKANLAYAEYQIKYLQTVNAAIVQDNPLESIVAKTTAAVFTNLQSALKKDEPT